MKHLLDKNGTSKTPELEEDVQCEKLLNSLAKQQRQSSVTEISSPPTKRQRFLGVNKSNEVIIVEDQSPSKPSLSDHNHRVVSFYGSMPGKVVMSSPQVTAPGSSCVDVPIKPMTIEHPQQPQPCNNLATEANEVICIDDDEDDAVLVVNDSPEVDSCAVVLSVSDKNSEPQCSVLNAQKASVVPASSSTDCVRNSNSDRAAAGIDRDDTANSEQLPSSSKQVTGSVHVDGQHRASADASAHCLRSSNKVARLEKLLTVGVFSLYFFKIKNYV